MIEDFLREKGIELLLDGDKAIGWLKFSAGINQYILSPYGSIAIEYLDTKLNLCYTSEEEAYDAILKTKNLNLIKLFKGETDILKNYSILHGYCGLPKMYGSGINPYWYDEGKRLRQFYNFIDYD